MTDTKKTSPNRTKKEEKVAEIAKIMSQAKNMFLTDYRGLTHQQLEHLRKSLKKTEADIMVAKNTLIKLALEKWSKDKAVLESLGEKLKEPTMAFFSMGDEIAGIKELAGFIKANQLPKIKIGIFDGRVTSPDDFKKLSVIPDRPTLYAQLVGRMKSPLYGLHYALNWNLVKLVNVLGNIKETKTKSN